MNRQFQVALAVVVLAVTMPAAAKSCDPPPEAEVRALISAANVAELDAAAATVGQHAGLRALYRSRRYELVATDAEVRRYFRGLPRTESEYWCIYSLTTPGELSTHRDVSHAVYAMSERAAKIARKLGIGHDRVIQLALWSDGEIAEGAWEATDWLLVNDSELMAAAVKRLSAPDQKRMCGGSVVEEMTVRQIVQRCGQG